VFAVAAIVRLAVGASLWTLPLVKTPRLDSAEYFSWASRIASGDWTWPVVAQHGPGYPVMLAGLLDLGGGSLTTALALQSLFGAFAAAMVCGITRRAYGDRAGLFAGLAYAVYGPVVLVDTTVLSEGLLLFLLTLGLWILSSRRMSATVAAASGAAFGLAVLVRPTTLVVVVACALWVAFVAINPDDRRSARGRSFIFAAAFCSACAIVVAPAVVRSWIASRTLSIHSADHVLAEEWAFTGSALISERDLPAAERAYRHALDMDPRSGLAWDGLGLAMYDAGRMDEARTAMERALTIDADNARAHFHLGLVAERQDRVDAAIAAYERALALSPMDVEVTGRLAGARRKIAVRLGWRGRPPRHATRCGASCSCSRRTARRGWTSACSPSTPAIAPRHRARSTAPARLARTPIGWHSRRTRSIARRVVEDAEARSVDGCVDAAAARSRLEVTDVIRVLARRLGGPARSRTSRRPVGDAIAARTGHRNRLCAGAASTQPSCAAVSRDLSRNPSYQNEVERVRSVAAKL
jgi:tetratricopeptide (TPR) repeat protein